MSETLDNPSVPSVAAQNQYPEEGQKDLASGNISTSSPSSTTGLFKGYMVKRRSSLELRQTPNLVLFPGSSTAFMIPETSSESLEEGQILGSKNSTSEEDSSSSPARSKTWLQYTCLNPKYSLLKQMMLSFGSVSAFTILFIMVASILVTISAGNAIKKSSKNNLNAWANRAAGASARYISEISTPYLYMSDVVDILAEFTKDRFVGYPDHPQYLDGDTLVPFYDSTTEQNKYPFCLQNNNNETGPVLLPLEWQIQPDEGEDEDNVFLKASNAETRPASTSTAYYVIQGMCDPSEHEINSRNYYPNCTDANNDMMTGGVVVPTKTAALLAEKGTDLTVILKSLFEYHQEEIHNLGVMFKNSGAGLSVGYPHIASLKIFHDYISIGCEWMSNPNPLDPSKPIGTPEEIARCRPKGTQVSSKLYNPLERGWCRDQALHPNKVRSVGPYPAAYDRNIWLMNVGRAIYDRETKEFVACTFIGVSLDRLSDRVTFENDNKNKKSNSNNNTDGTLVEPDVTIVRWDSVGTVVESPRWDFVSEANGTSVTNPKLDIGVSAEIFTDMKSLVEFTNTKWNAPEARRQYEEKEYRNDGKLIKCSPIPSIPDKYTADYVPEFLAITSIAESEYLKPALQAEQDVDDAMREMIIFIVTFGLLGFVLLLLIIYVVSKHLTRPLKWMNDVANQIVNGDDLDDTNIECSYKKTKSTTTGKLMPSSPTNVKTSQPFFFSRSSCTRRTELTDVVDEFQEMVARFSGEGTSRYVKRIPTETLNEFRFFAEFQQLYQSRQDKGFEYGYGPKKNGISTNEKNSPSLSASTTPETTKAIDNSDNASDTVPTTDEEQSSTAPLPTRCNFGSNIHANTENSIKALNNDVEGVDSADATSSRLFRWIAGLIVIPLMIVLITMAVVAVTIGFAGENSQYRVLYSEVEQAFISFETQYQTSATVLRAKQASDILEVFFRDLFLLTRVSGWLLSGALQTKGTMTYMSTAAEECKTASERGTCDYFRDEVRTPCACDWNDVAKFDNGRSCSSYPNSNQSSRYKQRIFYECQSENSEPNGDRYETNYPNSSSTADTTAWWSNITNLPIGEQQQEPATTSIYDSTYDRAKIASALSTIMMPIYNKAPIKNIGSYVAFEADGSIAGYTGCNNTHGDWPFWQSTEENRASKYRPDLCPLGKYGFDPRCRGWYSEGRKRFQSKESPVYVTAPYIYASRATGQSCSSPLYDPHTKEYIGQTLLDFHPTQILDSLKPTSTRIPGNGFSILMTVDGGDDAIVGPNYSLTDGPRTVQATVLPYDQEEKCTRGDCEKNRENFENILDEMREGKSIKDKTFWRTSEKEDQEKVFITAAPVFARYFSPLNSSDFASGVKPSSSLVFSLAMASTEDGLVESFNQVEDDMEKQARRSIIVFAVLIAVSAIVVLVLSWSVAASITDIVVQLLEVIRSINKVKIGDELPELHATTKGGSSELLDIYHTFEILHKVVRFSNFAYFRGDLETSHAVTADALKLFTRLNNQKAVGVASNNLGNTLLAEYRTLKATEENTIAGSTKEQIITKGLACFGVAIKLGEDAYDKFYEEEGWSNNCLVFMQHLSNRYFNRAIFLLTVAQDSERPDEIEKQGFRDLDIARNMDVEVVDQCVEAGFTIDRQEHFDLLLSRIRGLLNLIDLGYDITDFDVHELIAEALNEIKIAMKVPSRGLFVDVGLAGRMQQVDAEIIKYINLTTNDTEEAAKIAIRMLIEDEHVCSTPHSIALETIMEYVSTSDEMMDDRERVLMHLSDLLDLNYEENVRIETARAIDEERQSMVGSVRGKLSKRMTPTSQHAISTDKSLRNKVSVKEIKRGDVTMEVF